MKNIMKKLILTGIALGVFIALGANFAQAMNASVANTIANSPNTNVPGAPIIVTGYAKPVGTTTATLRGTVNPNNGFTTAYFDLILPGGSSGYSSSPESLGNGNTPVSMTPYNLTNLTPNTTYKFRITAINQYGTSTELFLFTTTGIIANLKPTIVSANASQITSTSAVLDGIVNPNGFSTDAWFHLGTPLNPPLGFQNIGNGTSPVALTSYTLIGLNPGTTYNFRVEASNANGTSYGSWSSFTTNGIAVGVAPTLISVSPSSGAQGQNNLNVGLTGTGFITGSTVTFSGSGITINNTTINSTTSITLDISIDISASTGTRNVRVINANGTSNPGTFKVLGYTNIPPTLISLSPANGIQGQNLSVVLTGTNFDVSSTVNFVGNGITLNNTTINSDTSITTDISINGNATVGGSNVTVTNTYGTSNAQIFTVNSSYNGGGGGGGGGGGSGYLYPTVTTDSVTGVNNTSAILNGTINHPNSTTSVWFAYGTSYNLLNATETNHTYPGYSYYSSPVSQSIYNLLPNTIYYFQAVTNSSINGTTRGNILSFTTTGAGAILPPPPIVNTTGGTNGNKITYQNGNTGNSGTTTLPETLPTNNNYFGNNNLGASALLGFANFLPKTFLGWLIFLILILLAAIIVKKIYQDYHHQKLQNKVNANNIENLPF